MRLESMEATYSSMHEAKMEAVGRRYEDRFRLIEAQGLDNEKTREAMNRFLDVQLTKRALQLQEERGLSFSEAKKMAELEEMELDRVFSYEERQNDLLRRIIDQRALWGDDWEVWDDEELRDAMDHAKDAKRLAEEDEATLEESAGKRQVPAFETDQRAFLQNLPTAEVWATLKEMLLEGTLRQDQFGLDIMMGDMYDAGRLSKRVSELEAQGLSYRDAKLQAIRGELQAFHEEVGDEGFRNSMLEMVSMKSDSDRTWEELEPQADWEGAWEELSTIFDPSELEQLGPDAAVVVDEPRLYNDRFRELEAQGLSNEVTMEMMLRVLMALMVERSLELQDQGLSVSEAKQRVEYEAVRNDDRQNAWVRRIIEQRVLWGDDWEEWDDEKLRDALQMADGWRREYGDEVLRMMLSEVKRQEVRHNWDETEAKMRRELGDERVRELEIGGALGQGDQLWGELEPQVGEAADATEEERIRELEAQGLSYSAAKVRYVMEELEAARKEFGDGIIQDLLLKPMGKPTLSEERFDNEELLRLVLEAKGLSPNEAELQRGLAELEVELEKYGDEALHDRLALHLQYLQKLRTSSEELQPARQMGRGAQPVMLPSAHPHHGPSLTVRQLENLIQDLFLFFVFGSFCCAGIYFVYRRFLFRSGRVEDKPEEVSSPQRRRTQQQSGPSGGKGGKSGGRRARKQRKRQRRRRQRVAASAQEENDDDTSSSEDDSSRSNENEEDEESVVEEEIGILLGEDLLDSNLAINAREAEDACPCCRACFQVELQNTHVVVLPCLHACCLPCLGRLGKQSSIRQQSGTQPLCPICRQAVPEEFLQTLPGIFVSQTTSIQDRLVQLRLPEEEKLQLCRELLFQQNFVPEDVLYSLDSMLADNLRAELRRSDALSPEEKGKIYDEARRPVDALFKELRQLRFELRSLHDQECNEFAEKTGRVQEIQGQLIPAAQKNAADEIWNRMNTAGSMGRGNAKGVFELDFHALHVDEAKEKFDDTVMPVLPVVGKVLLVVGRGRHSEGGVPRLKRALRGHAKQHPLHRQMKCYEANGNRGALVVMWVAS